jgi:hypothetical protein
MADHDPSLGHILDSISAATITRRGVVMATLAAGIAFTLRPVSAETLTTDQIGLTAGVRSRSGPTKVTFQPIERGPSGEQH